MNRRAFLTAAFAVSAVPAATLPAAVLAQGGLSPEDQALVERARAYLESLDTVRGRFTQTDPRGRSSAGTFAIKRPNRMRFDYDAPSGLIVAADGSSLLQWDRRLHTFDRVPLGSTPLDLFLGSRIRFDRATVQRVARGPDGFSITAQVRGRNGGTVQLNFGDEPVVLRGWTATTPQGQRTTISLSGMTPARLPNSFFVLNPPARDRRSSRPLLG